MVIGVRARVSTCDGGARVDDDARSASTPARRRPASNEASQKHVVGHRAGLAGMPQTVRLQWRCCLSRVLSRWLCGLKQEASRPPRPLADGRITPRAHPGHMRLGHHVRDLTGISSSRMTVIELRARAHSY